MAKSLREWSTFIVETLRDNATAFGMDALDIDIVNGMPARAPFIAVGLTPMEVVEYEGGAPSAAKCKVEVFCGAVPESATVNGRMKANEYAEQAILLLAQERNFIYCTKAPEYDGDYGDYTVCIATMECEYELKGVE